MRESSHPTATELKGMPTADLIARITRCGLDIPPGLPEEIVRRGEEARVPLCAIASDAAAWEADEAPEAWTPILAIFLLGAIGDARSAPVLVEVLRTRELGDFLCEGIAGILAWLGRGAIEFVDPAARDPALDSFQRAMATLALYGIGCRDPSARGEVAARLTSVVREADDAEFVALVADAVAHVDDVDAQRALDAAFAEGRVFEGMIGRDDVTRLREEPPWTLVREISDPMGFFSARMLDQLRRVERERTEHRARAAERPAANARLRSPSTEGGAGAAVRATLKVGRNDPLPVREREEVQEVPRPMSGGGHLVRSRTIRRGQVSACGSPVE
jgi:hypothetical protein